MSCWCSAGLLLMAVGFAGLGYAAQRALTLAKRVAPTVEAAAVEAAKVEACIAKVVDTPYITQPSSSVSSVHREDLKKGEPTKGHVDGGQNGHGHATNGTADGYRQSEVHPRCLTCPATLPHTV